MPKALEVRGVGVRFGDFQAVADVDLNVASGSIHSVIGPNGAGKTTLFNALTGVRPPTTGQILFGDEDVARRSSHYRVRCGMARSFQVTNIFQELTVAENLRLGVQALSPSGGGRVFWRSPARDTDVIAGVEKLLVMLRLEERAGTRAGDLSHGGQRALEIGMALASDPQIIFLDEPLAGMGIDDVYRTRDLIRNLAPARTVMLVEHNMSVVLDISDRITVLAQGRKIAEGPPAEIRVDKAVRTAYLGGSA
jgi:branched-chain amino acid transport system ATP-binding protein